VVANDWTRHYDKNPAELKPFPQQAVASMQAGVNHLGFPTGTEVDSSREFYPAGQGVGAINELIPAGDLVRRIVDDAAAVLARIGKLSTR
jgi:enoyl-[acyl-carrier protein] reductase II